MPFLRPLRSLAAALASQDSPGQLAAGFSLGMVVGLVPKANLTAQLLALVLFASKANLGSGLLAAFVFSWAGMLLDPLAHRIGLALLEAGPLRGLWTLLYGTAVVPWTAFNNTVVLGQLVIGLALAWPAYLLSAPAFARVQPLLAEKLRKTRMGQLLLGADALSRLR